MGKIEDILASVGKEHKEVIIPYISTQLNLPRQDQQLSLFDPDGLLSAGYITEKGRKKLGQILSNATGEYFEWLTVFLYGGRRVEKPFYIPHPVDDVASIEELCLSESEIERNRGKFGRPDVVDEPNKFIWESKGCGEKQRCILFDGQVDVYSSLQVRKPSFKTFYVIYVHGVDGIKSEPEKRSATLFKDLASNTNYALILPLSLIIKLHDPEKTNSRNSFVYRYVAGDKNRQELGFLPKDYTSICRATKLGLLEDPEKTLHALKVNSNDYEFKRLLSPENFAINGYNLRQFPIIKIIDRNHENWVLDFRVNYLLDQGVAEKDISNQLKLIDESPDLDIPFRRADKPVYPVEDPLYKHQVLDEIRPQDEFSNKIDLNKIPF